MEQTSMTALISAFARAFHSQNNETAVFHDAVAFDAEPEAFLDKVAPLDVCGHEFCSRCR